MNTVLDEVEDVASRLEQSAAAIRQQASRVEIIRLDGSLATKDGATAGSEPWRADRPTEPAPPA